MLEGFLKQVQQHQGAITNVKARMQAEYAMYYEMKDADLNEDVKARMKNLMAEADSAITAYVGALKIIKLSVATLLDLARSELCCQPAAYAFSNQHEACKTSMHLCTCAC